MVFWENFIEGVTKHLGEITGTAFAAAIVGIIVKIWEKIIQGHVPDTNNEDTKKQPANHGDNEDTKEDIPEPKIKIDKNNIPPKIEPDEISHIPEEPKNSPEVIDLMAHAYNHDSKAQVLLGTMYLNGVGGLPCDYTKSLYWYGQAAEHGSSDGQYWLGFMYENGNGTLKDINKAVRCYQKAAAQGHSGAKEALSRLQ